jgi:hypothetical protein
MKFQLFLCVAYLSGLGHGARPSSQDNAFEFGRVVQEDSDDYQA